MNTNVMNPLPADNAGILAMLRELIRNVSKEVFLELVEELKLTLHTCQYGSQITLLDVWESRMNVLPHSPQDP